jgi:hypothetical protein
MFMNTRIVGVHVMAEDDEGIWVGPTVRALMEATPTRGGYSLELIVLGNDEEGRRLQVNVPMRGTLPAGNPMVQQSKVVRVLSGDLGDIVFVLHHCGIMFEGPACIGAFGNMIRSDVESDLEVLNELEPDAQEILGVQTPTLEAQGM